MKPLIYLLIPAIIFASCSGTKPDKATELAKLSETTYFGLLVAWAQEVERYCDRVGQSYEEVVSFYDEIPFFPTVKYFPGIIGGHCVMPNIEILRKSDDSAILKAIEDSNERKIHRDAVKELSPRAVNGKVAIAAAGTADVSER